MISKLLRLLVVALVFTFLLFLGCQNGNDNNRSGASYLLAYPELEGSKISVRWRDLSSGDLSNGWKNATDFPTQTPALTNIGVGAATFSDGGSYGNHNRVAWPRIHLQKMFVQYGLGMLFTGEPDGPLSDRRVLSAPSVVQAGDNWLFAFRVGVAGDEKVALRLLEEGKRTFSGEDFEPNAGNQNVAGRPVMVSLNNKLILSWLKRTPNDEDNVLRMAVYSIAPNTGRPTLSTTFDFPPATIPPGFYIPDDSWPTLTHDFRNFYIGFTLKANHPGLAGTDLFIYRSTDGLTWEGPPIATGLGVKSGAFVNIAGQSDGSILAAIVQHGGRGNPEFEVWVFQNGNKTELSADAIFGSAPDLLQFALIPVKPFNEPCLPSAAGASQSVCGLATTLAAINPAIGTGEWTVVGPGNVTFGHPNQHDTNVTVDAFGSYTFTWTVSNPPCPPAVDDVTISFADEPSVAVAGEPQSVCGLTTTLAAINPAIGTGKWTVVGPGNATFGHLNQHDTNVTVDAFGSYTFTWTVSNDPCAPAVDDVTIVFVENIKADAGDDQLACGNSALLAGNLPTVGTGTWSIESGSGGSLNNANRNDATFAGQPDTRYTLRWTISNDPCPSSFDEMTIEFDNTPPTCATSNNNNTITISISDPSGIQAIEHYGPSSVNMEPLEYVPLGWGPGINSLMITARPTNDSSPPEFTLKVIDMCGNFNICEVP